MMEHGDLLAAMQHECRHHRSMYLRAHHHKLPLGSTARQGACLGVIHKLHHCSVLDLRVVDEPRRHSAETAPVGGAEVQLP